MTGRAESPWCREPTGLVAPLWLQHFTSSLGPPLHDHPAQSAIAARHRQGPGLAHFVIDYGPEADLLWVVFMDKDGACWSVPNPDVRMHFNWSMGRRKEEPQETPSAAEAPLAPAAANADEIGNVTRVFPRASRKADADDGGR